VESKLSPLGTAATYRRIVPAPGDYDDGEIGGMMIGKGNRSTRRKPAPARLCPYFYNGELHCNYTSAEEYDDIKLTF
jgi:hypothetical protein